MQIRVESPFEGGLGEEFLDSILTPSYIYRALIFTIRYNSFFNGTRNILKHSIML
jgi:hypothetical protein